MISGGYLIHYLLQVVDHTFQTDKKVVHLVRSMEDAFAFVRERETLANKMLILHQSIQSLLKQTTECCMFVRRYTERGFLGTFVCSEVGVRLVDKLCYPGRMLNIDASRKIDEFETALSGFKEEIESGTVLNTALVSLQVLEQVNEISL